METDSAKTKDTLMEELARLRQENTWLKSIHANASATQNSDKTSCNDAEALRRQCDQLEYWLRERVKEQSCLYAVSDVAGKTDRPIEEMFAAVANLLPSGWQHPGITAARITYEDQIFTTENFTETRWCQSAGIIAGGEPVGSVTVCYLEEMPEQDEGPFVKEERHLIDTIASRLSTVVDQRRALARLRDSEKRFRIYFKESLMGMAITSPQKGWLQVNQALCDILGYSADELKQTFWSAITHPEDLESDSAQFNRLLAGEIDGYRMEKRFIRKDGETAATLMSVKGVRNADGTIDYVLAQIQDITELKQMENMLEFERRQLLALFDGMEDVMYVSDPESYELLYVNNVFKKQWGADVIGEKCFKILQDREAPCPFCTNDRIFGTLKGQPYVWEFQNEINAHWYRCTDKAIHWPDGRWVRFETAADITEQIRTQEELSREKRLSESLINSLPGVFYLFDQEGRFIRWNQNFENVTEYSGEEIAKMTALDLFTGEDREHIANRIGRVFTDGQASAEAALSTKSGKKLPYTFSGYRVELEGVPYLVGVGIDITDRKEMEDHLKKANVELRRSNRELEQFAYVASHDLQEPLRMVSSYTQLLNKRYGEQLDDKAKKFIDYAVDGANRMQSLINDLLDYSRVGTRGGDFENMDSHAALGKALANLQTAIFQTNALVTNGDLPEIYADPAQVPRLFANLIANAIKFRGENPPRIHITAKAEGRKWRFSVTDNGIGIDPKFRDKIFVIFQRLHTRDQYPGTGIGLAICKRIVERHGGKIWFESKPGQGTVFYFTLPKNRKETPENE